MKNYNHYDPAVKWLFYNRDKVSEWLGRNIFYTPPSSNHEHFPHKYKWDVLFSCIIKARKGYSEDASLEILDLFDGQRPDGLVPSPQFVEKGREDDLERLFFTDNNTSDYGQPPIEALAAQEIYQGFETEGEIEAGNQWLSEIYPKLKASYDYFAEHRSQGPHQPLIFNVHPHETGRDSDPTFDFFKFRLRRKGKNTSQAVDATNRVLDYASVIMGGIEHWLDEWQTEKIRHRFEVYDVMFNCMYRDNLTVMANLAELGARASQDKQERLNYEADAVHYKNLSNEVEQAILKQMWFDEEGEDGLFLALKPDGPIQEVSVSNLFALTLPNLSEKQLEATLNLLENYFITPDIQLPIPSVPPINPIDGKSNPNYDPDHGEWDRLWRGSTWINMNWYFSSAAWTCRLDG